MSPPNGSRIFISYSHKNSQWKERLLKYLDVFDKHHLLEVWHDENMEEGAEWEEEIHRAMAEARLAVVLLCPEALKSTFMLNEELPILERRWRHEGLRVFPILCKMDGPWDTYPWLASLQIKPRLASGETAAEHARAMQFRHRPAEAPRALNAFGERD